MDPGLIQVGDGGVQHGRVFEAPGARLEHEALEIGAPGESGESAGGQAARMSW